MLSLSFFLYICIILHSPSFIVLCYSVNIICGLLIVEGSSSDYLWFSTHPGPWRLLALVCLIWQGAILFDTIRPGTYIPGIWVELCCSFQWYVVGTRAKSVTGACFPCVWQYINTLNLARVPHVVVLFLTMTSTPTKIFKDGKLRPGIYKIQNLQSKGFLDANEYSKEICCHPVKGPTEGLVRRYPYL